jgi:hypothetical protein
MVPGRIKVMHDWGCWALWDVSPTGAGNVDPAGLPIPKELAEAFDRWSAEWDSKLNRDDPAATDVAEEEVESLDRTGRELAQRLADALPRCEVLWQSADAADAVVVEPT